MGAGGAGVSAARRPGPPGRSAGREGRVNETLTDDLFLPHAAFPEDLQDQADPREEAEAEPATPAVDPPEDGEHHQVQRQAPALAPDQARPLGRWAAAGGAGGGGSSRPRRASREGASAQILRHPVRSKVADLQHLLLSAEAAAEAADRRCCTSCTRSSQLDAARSVPPLPYSTGGTVIQAAGGVRLGE